MPQNACILIIYYGPNNFQQRLQVKTNTCTSLVQYIMVINRAQTRQQQGKADLAESLRSTFNTLMFSVMDCPFHYYPYSVNISQQDKFNLHQSYLHLKQIKQTKKVHQYFYWENSPPKDICDFIHFTCCLENSYFLSGTPPIDQCWCLHMFRLLFLATDCVYLTLKTKLVTKHVFL